MLKLTAETKTTISLAMEMTPDEARTICSCWERVTRGVTGSLSPTMDEFVAAIKSTTFPSQWPDVLVDTTDNDD